MCSNEMGFRPRPVRFQIRHVAAVHLSVLLHHQLLFLLPSQTHNHHHQINNPNPNQHKHYIHHLTMSEVICFALSVWYSSPILSMLDDTTAVLASMTLLDLSQHYCSQLPRPITLATHEAIAKFTNGTSSGSTSSVPKEVISTLFSLKEWSGECTLLPPKSTAVDTLSLLPGLLEKISRSE